MRVGTQTDHVLLSLGSNMGEPLENLHEAVRALDSIEGIRVRSCSNPYETEPVGCEDQPAFLNMAVEVETGLTPLELLGHGKAIEANMGREPGLRWGPRVIDIDIILWESMMVAGDELTVPHKEFRNRAFVLTPLAEIAGGATDPVTGMTVAELADRPEALGWVKRVEV